MFFFCGTYETAQISKHQKSPFHHLVGVVALRLLLLLGLLRRRTSSSDVWRSVKQTATYGLGKKNLAGSKEGSPAIFVKAGLPKLKGLGSARQRKKSCTLSEELERLQLNKKYQHPKPTAGVFCCFFCVQKLPMSTCWRV